MTKRRGPPAASFWRKGVEPDESRVPQRPALQVERLAEDIKEEEEDEEVVRCRVAAREEELWLVSSDSKIYARWCLQGATPMKRKAGVVLVPGYPEFGATMDSNLIVTIADACQRAGLPTLRFDYRGIGKSKGVFDAVDCVRDVVEAIRMACGADGESGPFKSAAVVAFSFGSAQTIGNIYTKGVTHFISLSHGLGLSGTMPDGTRRPPSSELKDDLLTQLYNRTNIFFTTLRITLPKLWIVGEEDVLTDKDELAKFLTQYSPGRGELSTLVTVPNANHDLRFKERSVANRIVSWLTDPKTKPIQFNLDFASGPQTQTLS